MQSTLKSQTVVVGAGIIGMAIAHELLKRGHSVTVVDTDGPGRGASFGNMASIAVTEFMPVSRPSVWLQTPSWLLHPEGPIRVSPSYAPRLIPWLLHFVMAGRPVKVRALEEQGAALCRRALEDTAALLKEIGIGDHLSESGCLSLYANEVEFAADHARLNMLDRHGFRYEVLGHNALHDLEPELAPNLEKAVLLPNNRTLKDPYTFVTRLVEVMKGRGGTVVRGKVVGFDRADRVKCVRLDDGRELKADTVVLAAGAFTGRLSHQLGEPIPLETERGYHTQINSPGIKLGHSIIWPAKAFMVSPTGGGIRVGGTVEMAGLDAAPDWRRSKITVKRAREALPNLQVEDATEWMGHRPALPDTVPVMSASARVPGVFYATGHGHLGLTYAATTGRLMGQLIAEETPDIDLSPYRVDRF